MRVPQLLPAQYRVGGWENRDLYRPHTQYPACGEQMTGKCYRTCMPIDTVHANPCMTNTCQGYHTRVTLDTTATGYNQLTRPTALSSDPLGYLHYPP
jgi:hypothetical protein